MLWEERFIARTGLINCYNEDIKLPDIEVYGVPFNKLLKYGCFTRNFDITYKSKAVIFDILETIDVPKPRISKRTKERLGLPDSWETDELKSKELEIHEEKIEETESSFVQALMMRDEDFEEIKNTLTWDTTPLQQFVINMSTSDFFNTMQTVTEIQFPSQSLSIIKNLKYDCICSLITDQGMINRSTIASISRIVTSGKLPVIYSLISRYDRLVSDTGQSSPEDVRIILNNSVHALGIFFGEDEIIFQ
jgi:uncharacterized protein YerC